MTAALTPPAGTRSWSPACEERGAPRPRSSQMNVRRSRPILLVNGIGWHTLVRRHRLESAHNLLPPVPKGRGAMIYSGFTIQMATRGVALLAVPAFAGFSSVQLLATTMAASSDKVAENRIHQCYPEPESGCIGIKKRAACLVHPRCRWTNDAAGGYCRPIACWI